MDLLTIHNERSRASLWHMNCQSHYSCALRLSLNMGWLKSLFRFFCQIKDTFFPFTNNFIDLDILSMSAISSYCLLVGRGQGCC